MVRQSRKLFDVVKSLSKNEKRYVKLFITKNSPVSSEERIRLFDSLNRMEAYDENVLTKNTGIRSEDLAGEKRNLYKSIMKGMRVYHTSRNAKTRLKEQLLDADFLYGKGLFAQCHHELLRIKNEAYKYELYPIILEVIDLERELVKRLKLTNIHAHIQALIEEKNKAIQILERIYQYKDVYDEIYLFSLSENISRNPEKLSEINKWMLSPLLTDPGKANSFYARHFYLQIQAIYHIQTNNPYRYNVYCRELINLWNDHPEIKKDGIFKYKIILTNLLSSCHFAGFYADFPLILDEIESLPQTNAQDKSRTQNFLVYYRLIYYMNTHQWERARDLEKEAETILANPDKIKKHYTIGLKGNFASLFFVLEDYDKASNWVNRILSAPKTEVREDIQLLARLYQLIISFEQKNYMLFESLYRSTTRFMHKKGHTSESLERLVLKNLRQLFNTFLDKEKHLDAIHSFKDQLDLREELKTHIGYDEIGLWLRGKLQNKSIATLIETD